MSLFLTILFYSINLCNGIIVVAILQEVLVPILAEFMNVAVQRSDIAVRFSLLRCDKHFPSETDMNEKQHPLL